MNSNTDKQGKKPYHAPRISDYGKLDQLTKGGGTGKNDPGGGGADTRP